MRLTISIIVIIVILCLIPGTEGNRGLMSFRTATPAHVIYVAAVGPLAVVLGIVISFISVLGLIRQRGTIIALLEGLEDERKENPYLPSDYRCKAWQAGREEREESEAREIIRKQVTCKR